MNPILDNLVVIDIETVPSVPNFGDLSERMKKQWERKAQFFRNEEDRSAAELFEDRGGIYAEFGKVVCIGMGYYTYSGKELSFRVLSLVNHDEKTLLEDFIKYMNKFPEKGLSLCAHNGKEFDYPYLCRRMLVHGLALPSVLQISGKKPWEIALHDTMELWKFGDYKHYTSLDLLAGIFNVESSKQGMDGSQVSDVFYVQNDLQKIADYCVRDVVVTAQVFLRLNQMDALPEEQIHFISNQ